MTLKGAKFSDAHKKQLRLAHLGHKHLPETIEKIRKSSVGKEHYIITDSTREKMRQARIGKKHTKYTKERISISTYKSILAGKRIYQLRAITKVGRRVDLDNRYFRSRWEANYARYLNWLIKQKQISKWEYEPETFWFEKVKRGTRSYLPDFKITSNDGSIEYHEVKGWMDSKSITKLKRMKKYYPEIKLVIIDGTFYKDLRNKMSRILENWED